MTDDLMRMASFRIDKELWAKFGAIAKRERLTVTDVLTDYIQRCTDNDRTEYAVNTSNDSMLITGNDNINNAVMTVINTLSLPSNDDVNTRIKAEVDLLADLITELEAYTRSQIDTLRTELKKPLAIAR